MADAFYPAEAYRDAILSLLPRGRVWSKEPGSLQYRLADGFAQTFERLDARAQSLLVDLFPAFTVELLPEWEASLGLPDPCEGADQTIEQRRLQVVTKLTVGGGQSIAYFVTVLDRLGYTNATITEYAPFRIGVSPVGLPLLDDDWWFAWNINLPDVRAFYFSAGESAVGEALATYSGESVFCVIEALKPAHTIVTYTFDPA